MMLHVRDWRQRVTLFEVLMCIFMWMLMFLYMFLLISVAMWWFIFICWGARAAGRADAQTRGRAAARPRKYSCVV